MKRQFSLGFTYSVLTILFFSSCQKELGNIKSKELEGAPLPGQSTYCRIESIWHYPDLTGIGNEQHYQLILYNEFENPVAITSHDPRTYPYHVFKYDSWHRLREYRGLLHGAVAFTHLYGYDQNGRISVDTAYLYGSPEFHYYRTITTFEYDSHNRIVKGIYESNILPDLVPTLYQYEYDSRGNLILPGVETSYDDRPSIYRTNDIWMFLARDYSVNNRFRADEYNSAGFGTKFSIQSGEQYAFIGLNSIHLINAQISYNCRPAYW